MRREKIHIYEDEATIKIYILFTSRDEIKVYSWQKFEFSFHKLVKKSLAFNVALYLGSFTINTKFCFTSKAFFFIFLINKTNSFDGAWNVTSDIILA